MAAWVDPVFPEEKTELYRVLNAQLAALVEGESDVIANMANMSALLFGALKEINWAGFYLYKESLLVLGPFQGKPACIRIPMGRGVCGMAAKTQQTQLVPNVHAFPGHIACDGASQSEIVIPLVKDGRLLGVMDIDSPRLNRFDEADKQGLEAMAHVLVQACTWPY